MLGLVHKVQQRTLRSHHEDAHYCAKNYKNLRHYSVMLKQKLVATGSDACVAFVSSDDKAKVCLVSCAFRCDSDCTVNLCLW